MPSEKFISKYRITFRPHHFMCSIGYSGYGYSDSFTSNFDDVIAQLRSSTGDQTPIIVVRYTDSICRACPNRRGLLCQDQSKIDQLDNRHLEILKLTVGEEISYGEVKQRIKTYVDKNTFDYMCEGCSWKSSGICENALTKLKNYK